MLGDDLLSHADAHYHWRWCVSRPSSGRDRVVPHRYGRQAKGATAEALGPTFWVKRVMIEVRWIVVIFYRWNILNGFWVI